MERVKRSPALASLDFFPVVRTALDLAADQDDEAAAHATFTALREHLEVLDKQLRGRGEHVSGADRAITLPNRLTVASIAVLQVLIVSAQRKEMRLAALQERETAAELCA